MDEATWLNATDPQPMLDFLRGKASDRKLRLFAAARCRLFRPDWDDMSPIREAVDAAEQLSDGLSPAGQLTRHHYSSEEFNRALSVNTMDPWAGSTVLLPDRLSLLLVQAISSPDAGSAARGVLWDDLRGYFGVNWKDGPQEQRTESHLLREVFGNPFRPSPPLPHAVLARNDRIIPRLAQAVYEDRKMPKGTQDNRRLAILADALLDGGCDDEDLIAHCREPGMHVRGCWAVDLILGKG
jgi:hypothetical protein